MEGVGPAARPRHPIILPCSTNQARRAARQIREQQRNRSGARTVSTRRLPKSLAAPTAGRCPMPESRPCSTSPTGRMPPPARFRRARRGIGRSADGSRRHQPRRRALWPASGARHRAHRPVQPRARNHAARRYAMSPTSAMCRCARATASTSRSRTSPSFYDRVREAGVRPGLGRRRPFDHLSDPEGARRRAAGRPCPYRRALRHDGRDRRARNSIMAARSARRCSPARSTPSARSRSASAARPRSSGGFPTIPG